MNNVNSRIALICYLLDKTIQLVLNISSYYLILIYHSRNVETTTSSYLSHQPVEHSNLEHK